MELHAPTHQLLIKISRKQRGGEEELVPPAFKVAALS